MTTNFGRNLQNDFQWQAGVLKWKEYGSSDSKIFNWNIVAIYPMQTWSRSVQQLQRLRG